MEHIRCAVVLQMSTEIDDIDIHGTAQLLAVALKKVAEEEVLVQALSVTVKLLEGCLVCDTYFCSFSFVYISGVGILSSSSLI